MRCQPFSTYSLPSRVTRLATSLAFFFLVAVPALAEDETETAKPRTVIKATMHVDVSEVESVLGLLDVDFALKPDQNLIVVRGEDYAVETAMKVIDALDTPRPTIELNVYVVAASHQGKTEVPAHLEAAVGQLKTVFGYSGFQLLDTVALRVLEGRYGRADGGIRLGEDDGRTGYSLSFQKASVVPENGDLKIRLKGLKFNVDGDAKVGGMLRPVRANLMPDVQIREGQKAVVGSSTPQGVGDTLILIIEAKAPRGPQDND